MEELIYSDEFVFWIKCTLALKLTKDGLVVYVENAMKELIESFGTYDEEHIGRFLNKIIKETKRMSFQRDRGTRQWVFRSKCNSTCQRMFNTIMENHTAKASYKLNWDVHDPSISFSPDNYWWIIAKIYMSSNNEKSLGPDEVDPLSILSLLMSCKLFGDVWENAEKIIALRNMLMHTATNTVDETKMKNAFKDMKALLTHREITKTSSMAVAAIERVEKEHFFLSNVSAKNNEMMLKALQLKHDALEQEIKTPQPGESVEILKMRFKETEKRIESAKQYIAERPFRAQLREKDELLKQSRQALDKKDEENETLETKLKEMTQRYEEEKSKNSDLERQCADKSEKMKDKETRAAHRLEKLQEEKLALQAECAKSTECYSKEQNNVFWSEMEKADLLGKIQEQESNEVRTAEQLKNLQENNKKLETQVQELKRFRNESLKKQKECDALKKEVEKLRQDYFEKERERKELERKVESLTEEFQQIYSEKERERKELERTVESLTKKS